MPQEMITRSPTASRLTARSTSVIVPTPSCPRIRPSVTAGTSPLRMCRSVPQIVAATATITSVGSMILGSGTSSHAFRPGPWYTRAIIRYDLPVIACRRRYGPGVARDGPHARSHPHWPGGPAEPSAAQPDSTSEPGPRSTPPRRGTPANMVWATTSPHRPGGGPADRFPMEGFTWRGVREFGPALYLPAPPASGVPCIAARWPRPPLIREPPPFPAAADGSAEPARPPPTPGCGRRAPTRAAHRR